MAPTRPDSHRQWWALRPAWPRRTTASTMRYGPTRRTLVGTPPGARIQSRTHDRRRGCRPCRSPRAIATNVARFHDSPVKVLLHRRGHGRTPDGCGTTLGREGTWIWRRPGSLGSRHRGVPTDPDEEEQMPRDRTTAPPGTTASTSATERGVPPSRRSWRSRARHRLRSARVTTAAISGAPRHTVGARPSSKCSTPRHRITSRPASSSPT